MKGGRSRTEAIRNIKMEAKTGKKDVESLKAELKLRARTSPKNSTGEKKRTK